MQKVVMFCRDQIMLEPTIDYQLQDYLDSHPNYSVKSIAFAKYGTDLQRLLVVFDVKE